MNKEFYKIYINENLLQLITTNDVPFIILDETEQLVHYNGNAKNIMDYIVALEKNKAKRIVIHHESLEQLLNDFCSHYTLVYASGGVVKNTKTQKILSIFRRGFWDFPKGKIELGERRKEAAIREVQEECGIDKLSLGSKIGTTYHSFGNVSNRKLKVSYWYMMETQQSKLTPQIEEDITDIKWFEPSEFTQKARPIFKNISDVFEAYTLKTP